MKKAQVQDVIDNLNKRMATHINSMCASDDEVSMALLICHIQDLEKAINDAKNCLVCAAIGDPMEVCTNTLAILEAVEE